MNVLTELKKRISDDFFYNTALEKASMAMSKTDDSIRDVFLSDMQQDGDGGMVASQDTDRELERLIDSLPDIEDDSSNVSDEDVEKITENYIPESIISTRRYY